MKNYSMRSVILGIVLITLAIFTLITFIQFEQFKTEVKTEQSRYLLTLQSYETREEQIHQQQHHQIKNLITEMQLFQNQGINKDEWLMDEAQFFVRFAQLNLFYSGNLQAALHLLKMADKQLAQHENPKFLTLRQAISQDIQMLEKNKQLNAFNLLIQVDNLQHNYQLLKQKNMQYHDQALTSSNKNTEKLIQAHSTTKPQTYSSLQAQWKTYLTKTVESLRQLVIIRRWDNTVQPLIAQDERQLINLHIEAIFDRIKWAILHRNNDVYHASLTELSESTKHYALMWIPIKRQAGAGDELLNLMDQIKQLQQINVNAYSSLELKSANAFSTLANLKGH